MHEKERQVGYFQEFDFICFCVLKQTSYSPQVHCSGGYSTGQNRYPDSNSFKKTCSLQIQ